MSNNGLILREIGKIVTDATINKNREDSLLSHPVWQLISMASQEQLKQFCAVRYSPANRFEAMLRRGIELAQSQELPEIVDALTKNLRDELGLDRETGVSHDLGSHGSWRQDFFAALGELPEVIDPFPLYSFKYSDSLSTLVGMMLAAEMTIGAEDKLILTALENACPEKFAPNDENAKARLYLADHVKHDRLEHYPWLAKAIADVIERDRNSVSMDGIKDGINCFVSERIALYNRIMQECSFNLNAATITLR
jgi:hypothetical protein